MRILAFLFGSIALLHAQVATVTQTISRAPELLAIPEGFVFEKVFSVPGHWGSWVALTTLSDGSIAAADQYGALYRCQIAGEEVIVEPIEIELKGAHGLLAYGDDLYVVVNESLEHPSGVYRARDLDQNGSYEEVTCIRTFDGRGEHGVHSLVASPDRKWLYLIAGNRTLDPEVDHSHVPVVWGEDHLLPRMPDGRGHASELMAPGGQVLRMRPDGSQLERYSIGYRNSFDGAFDEFGELFIYDSDLEWDLGLPWYRPTRLSWAMAGSDNGWRHGSGKRPRAHADALPPVAEFGPGSPTGVTNGRGLKFPARYQRGLYCLDWSYSTIYLVEPKPEGHGYAASKSDFLAAKGITFTDATVGQDGALYLASGGRRIQSSLWRIRYEGPESTANAWREDLSRQARIDSAAPTDLWSHYRARTDLELAGSDAVEQAFRTMSEQENASRRLSILMAVARLEMADLSPQAWQKLLAIDWEQLTSQERLLWLRTTSLFAIRLGRPDEEQRAAVLALVDTSFPNSDPEVERELCRLLCYLNAPEIVERALARLAEPSSEAGYDSEWRNLLTRGGTGHARQMALAMRDLSTPDKIHFAYCLRVVPGPWTPGQRRQLMDWYAKEAQGKSFQSARLTIQKMREETLANATEEERAMIESWGLQVVRNPFENLPTAKGPGKAWTVAEMVAISENLSDANLKNGDRMFRASLCAACHRVGGEGGSSGPDLTTLGLRFSGAALAKAILEPSHEVSDQFQFSQISKADGSTIVGRIIAEKDEILIVATNAFDYSATTEVSRSDITNIERSPVSPMPAGLVNQLNRGELRDLVAYLLAAGVE